MAEPKKYQLYIDGKPLEKRGLDLAYNPKDGSVKGKVKLVAESLLNDIKEAEAKSQKPKERPLQS